MATKKPKVQTDIEAPQTDLPEVATATVVKNPTDYSTLTPEYLKELTFKKREEYKAVLTEKVIEILPQAYTMTLDEIMKRAELGDLSTTIDPTTWGFKIEIPSLSQENIMREISSAVVKKLKIDHRLGAKNPSAKGDFEVNWS